MDQYNDRCEDAQALTYEDLPAYRTGDTVTATAELVSAFDDPCGVR